ncbi:hypothetical protein RF11_06375 [Thelohanellus kitauei]|uniref:Uncharacterized protein n=1 Tax=Thelohanellus kitauei TaxID=669202 RepID=A0A0C2ME46_THEKT|nr:hypothetical protein RF11_06375 [Thelohanellus kitauei]
MYKFYLFVSQTIVFFSIIRSGEAYRKHLDSCYQLINYRMEYHVSFRFMREIFIQPKRLFMNITLMIKPVSTDRIMATFVVQYELQIVNCTDLTSLTISNDKYPYNDIEVKIDVSVHGGFPLLTQYHFIVTPNTSESFLRINDNFLVAQLYVFLNPRTTFVRMIQQLIFNPEETRIFHHLVLERSSKFRCVFTTFIDRKIVIKYRMITPYKIDLYPSVLVNLEVYDNSDLSVPMIMNLSLGGWRIDCPKSLKNIDYNPVMWYENNGNNVIIDLTIFDSVNKHQETAIIKTKNNEAHYQDTGSINSTNINFNTSSSSVRPIKNSNVIPLVPFVRSQGYKFPNLSTHTSLAKALKT